MHSSMDWLGKAGVGDALCWLETLQQWVGRGGTLVMPSFPIRGSHLGYLKSRPLFDVRHTPSRAGLLTEIFRRSPNVRRTYEPDLPVAFWGEMGSFLASTPNFAYDQDPFGPGTTFRRLLDEVQPTLVGLGVSLNTNGFIHVVDSKLKSRYRMPLYSDDNFEATTVDYDGRRHTMLCRAVLDKIRNGIKPSAIFHEVVSRAEAFTSLRIGEVQFYRCNLSEWQEVCLQHANRRLSRGQLPIWLEALDSRSR